MGLKEQILAASDEAKERVDVPEWGCSFWLYTLSGLERDAMELESYAKRSNGTTEANMQNFRARLVVRTARDDAGVRVFEDSDAEALGKKNGAILDRLYAKAFKLNQYGAKDVEELAKN